MDALTKGTPDQASLVAGYFDKIAAGYSARYAEINPFHNYFFRQRLARAMEGVDFNGKTVLDIGAGTGELYEAIKARFPSVDYLACDISAEMLSNSQIPDHRAFVGSAPAIAFPRNRFDLIFSLGVTSYQIPRAMEDDFRFIADHLSDDGAAVISFTNRRSLDHVARRLMKLVKTLIKTDSILGQSFPMFGYSLTKIELAMAAHGLFIDRVAYLNQTLSPFNVLFPKTSVGVAKRIERFKWLLPIMSADFLVVAIKRRVY